LSKNTAMPVEDASKLTGALVQIGTEADQAKDSVQNLFNTLNAAERGENGSARAELDKLGVKIHTTKEGSAAVIPTLLELEEAFKNKNIPSETENRLIVKLGLTPEILALLREGKIEERLDKSKKFGLSRTAEENQKLTDFNTEANEASARFSGMWNRTKIDAATYFLDKGEEAEKKPAWQAIKDIRMRENDTADSFYHGNKEKDIRNRAVSDKEFISQLTFMEEFRLLRGKPDESLQKKLDDRYGEAWEKQKKAHEAKTAANKIPALPKYETPNYPNPLKNSGNSTASLESMSGYFATLEKKYGLDPGLLHGVAMTESAGNPNAIGKPTKSGQAKGMFQFMPGTAAEWGLKGNDVFDPYKSAEAAAKMLGSLLKTHNGNLNKALASYNWGIGNVQKEGMGNMPTETRNYIPKVKKNMASGAAIAEKNTNRQEQQFSFPSLYGQKKESKYEEVIAANIAKAVREAIGDKPFLVEIALVDNKTGERQKFQSKSSGKVTTSMQYS
ncbi:lytic transglycosylase domain-containing protein, partial [Xenorhabdus sp. XENO-10]